MNHSSEAQNRRRWLQGMVVEEEEEEEEKGGDIRRHKRSSHLRRNLEPSMTDPFNSKTISKTL